MFSREKMLTVILCLVTLREVQISNSLPENDFSLKYSLILKGCSRILVLKTKADFFLS